MSDQQALLSAIIANAADDTPRLVYADWLDEHDQPERAEFIRVQCRLARAKKAEKPDLQKRSRELLGANGAAWAGGTYLSVYKYGFARGFLSWCSGPARGKNAPLMVDQLRVLLAREPIEKLIIYAHNSDQSRRIFYCLSGCGPCPSLKTLWLTIPYLRLEDVELLFDSPLVSTCKTVRLNRCQMSEETRRRFGELVGRKKLTLLQESRYEIIRPL